MSVLQIKTKIVSCQTADSKPVKQEVNGTVILPPLVFPGSTIAKKLIHFFQSSRTTPWNIFTFCKKKNSGGNYSKTSFLV
jgi:hypothetical protein